MFLCLAQNLCVTVKLECIIALLNKPTTRANLMRKFAEIQEQATAENQKYQSLFEVGNMKLAKTYLSQNSHVNTKRRRGPVNGGNVNQFQPKQPSTVRRPNGRRSGKPVWKSYV